MIYFVQIVIGFILIACAVVGYLSEHIVEKRITKTEFIIKDGITGEQLGWFSSECDPTVKWKIERREIKSH